MIVHNTVTDTLTTTSTSSTSAAAVNTGGDTTVTVSTGVTTTLPRASTSSSNTVTNPKDIPTPVQSTSANVFGGQAGNSGNTGGASSRRTDGGIQGGLLLGLVSVILLARL